MSSFYKLEPGRWTGLSESPVREGWPGSSPVLVTAVKPLKTGLGELEIDIIQPLHPGGGRRRTLIAKVVQKAATHLTCLFKEGEELRTAVLTQPNFAWLQSCCAELLKRRPPAVPLFMIDGGRDSAPDWAEYLVYVFGRDPDEVLRGAHRSSFKVKLGKMPKQHTQGSVGIEFGPLDSGFITRGFKPHAEEDKWFIVHEDDRLLFRRSWTGIMIYDVDAYWRGDKLYLGQININRQPGQYSETDDAYDVALLRYLVDVVLRGVPAEFPAKRQGVAEPLHAWCAAGSSSLT